MIYLIDVYVLNDIFNRCIYAIKPNQPSLN